jgi:hypothetical protein
MKEELSKEDAKRIRRYVESLYDNLSQIGLTIVDRKGEPFDYGLPEKVIAAHPQEGLSQEIVRETILPTINWDKRIFPGEVEISRPVTNNEKQTSN